MTALKISIVIPFYNTPIPFFLACLESVKKLNPFEIILVDDCSTDKELINLAKSSDCIYLKTPYQSGMDGAPFNLGVRFAKGDYVCRMDSDDILLALPDTMPYEVHFGHLDRVKAPVNLTFKELILAPRAICTAMVARREIWLKYPYAETGSVHSDVLCAMQILYHRHRFSVHPEVNYLYRQCDGSLQTSQTTFFHRLSHIQTVARFCQLEAIEPSYAIHLLELAMLNVRYGYNSFKHYKGSSV